MAVASASDSAARMSRGGASRFPSPASASERGGGGKPAAMPCSLSRPGALDAAGAEVGDEGGEDLGEVLRRRRRDKELPRCCGGGVGGIAVENLRRLFLRGALDRLQARADPGELRRRVRPRRRRRQADRSHAKELFATSRASAEASVASAGLAGAGEALPPP